MSIRFEEELDIAFNTKKAELRKKYNEFYLDSMELEIVDIQLLGNNFDDDSIKIKQLEDYWIDYRRIQGENLYNIAGGESGAISASSSSSNISKLLLPISY
ncbi:MAG: hypothetical protein ACFE9I_06070 [Candidatus Hermodarchaeota archaeon]